MALPAQSQVRNSALPRASAELRQFAEQMFARAAGAPLVGGNAVRVLRDAGGLGVADRVERDGAIVTVVINRAAKLNAMTKPMWRALGEAVSDLSADDSVRSWPSKKVSTEAMMPTW